MVTLNCVRGHLHTDPYCDQPVYQEMLSKLDIGNILHIHHSLGYPLASLSIHSIDIYTKGSPWPQAPSEPYWTSLSAPSQSSQGLYLEAEATRPGICLGV